MRFALISVLLVSPVAARARPASPCSANHIAVTFRAGKGEFTGMSHDGAWLTLRNTGKRACTVPRRPGVSFLDAGGKPVTAKLNLPVGMHPGPVLVPIVLQPGASARGGLRWVSGEVFGSNTCADIVRAEVAIGDRAISSRLRAHMCGDTAAGIRYDQQWLLPR